MKFFREGYFEWGKVEPRVWLQKWAELFLSSGERQGDNQVYESLVRKTQLSGEDFEQIGRWKEGCIPRIGTEHGRWKRLTSAAFDVWMQAKESPPQVPADKFSKDSARKFLLDWQERKFRKPVKGGRVQDTRFGLSRATALLHFMSAGRFPIYDSFEWYAFRRMGTPLPWEVTVDVYLEKFCPLLCSVASRCCLTHSIEELRKLDNALRCYGRRERKGC